MRGGLGRLAKTYEQYTQAAGAALYYVETFLNTL